MVRRLNPRYLAAAALVFGATFFVRTFVLWQDGALMYQTHADECIYYASTMAFWQGSMPYTDFIHLHPPGILAVLTPFVAIGSVFTESTGMFLARMGFVALAALNAVIVTTLIWRYGRIAAVGAGLFYASWNVVAIPEGNVQLVTIVNTMFLFAALLLQRWPKRTLLAGLFIGFACATKVWAVVFVPVFVPYIWAKHGRAAAFRFLAGVAAMVTVVCGPFAIIDPGAAWKSVVTEQLGRPSEFPPFNVVLNMFVSGGSSETSTLGALFVAAVLVAIASPLVVALASRSHPREWSDAAWLAMVVVVQLTMLFTAPVFYKPYAAFVGPQVALLWGGLLVLTMRHLRAATLVAVPVIAGAALTTISGTQFTAVDRPKLVDATSGYDCIWTLNASYLVESDTMSRNLAHGCGFQIDGYGFHMINSKDDRRSEAWQREVQGQLEKADAVVMGPLESWYLDETNRDYIRANFHNDVKFEASFFDIRERKPAR
ncbi:hypothetical protein J2X11_002153 [Aeromicrobium panaciterrae]|uniref:DUF2029 domain-containing protein n=1 Tax=Aeromicrobium panaciterrae TaxID=363861 RepID=A0ABU1UQ53_9ACTN|nr:glycosyltransferase 87 family protein [Aeromicrobium panaciterrae]MDR7087314.1 hypothetical protein [Aeromicrobium panaciterrae]